MAKTRIELEWERDTQRYYIIALIENDLSLAGLKKEVSKLRAMEKECDALFNKEYSIFKESEAQKCK